MSELVFLGTGTSNGVPMIGCDCAVCRSPDPRDKRTRSSVVIRESDATFLIDTATELRLQAIREDLRRVDAVLMTHAHADHTGGLDDLRRFNELMGQHIPIYANAITASMLRERFSYAFEDAFPFYGGKPDLTLHVVDGPFRASDHAVIPIPVMHGKLPVLGYRIGKIAYVTDAKIVPDESIDLLKDLDILVINALRAKPHPTHLSISEALELIEHVRPRQAFLTHLSHEVSHQAESERLPSGVRLAFDGLVVRTNDSNRS